MPRQERLSLFLAKERTLLQTLLEGCFGFCSLVLTSHEAALIKCPTQHQFYSSKQNLTQIDVRLDYTALPFPSNYFDCIILDHIVDVDEALPVIFREAARILRHDGVLLISGFERMRWCARLLQRQFAAKTGIKRKTYSLLDLQAQLLDLKFNTEVQHFDFCRARVLEKIIGEICPFLGTGFWLIARKQVIPLKLVEEAWDFMPAIAPVNKTRPEYYLPPKQN